MVVAGRKGDDTRKGSRGRRREEGGNTGAGQGGGLDGETDAITLPAKQCQSMKEYVG